MFTTAQKHNTCNNAELVRLLTNDDEGAFKKIYEAYRNRVYNVAFRYLKCDMQSQEVVQEVFLKLWIKRNDIKVDAPIEAWLFTVAKNNTLNKLKKIATENKAKVYLKYTWKGNEDTTFDRVRNSECSLQINKALKTLSQNQLKVYTLAREENLSHLQIAALLNISPLTVKTHMSRALQHLKLLLANI